MTRRLTCLSAFSMLVFLLSLGFQDGVRAQNAAQPRSQAGSPVQRRSAPGVRHAAIAGRSRMVKSASPAPTQIGFLSSIQTPAGGGTFPNFPAVLGDFKGDGNTEAAAIVNTAVPPSSPIYNIAVAISQGNGTFATKLTQVNTTPEASPAIFVGNLSGYTNGEDDILIVHPAPSGSMTTVEGWLSNGDGTFTSAGAFPGTLNGFIWATVDANGNVILADGATPNGNVCTLANTGKGVFSAPTCIPVQGALNPGSSPGVPGNPMVFADFNGDGFLDFAAASAGNGSTIALNQIVVYLCTSGTTPCTSYSAPTALATSGTAPVYDSCFLAGGDLNGDGKDELVSANCDDNNVTVYVNNGSGSFATGVYYAAGSRPVGVTVADVNGDGHNDVLASCTRSADIKVLLGNGDGTVQVPSIGYVTGGSPLVPPLVADFNGDGKADVVVPDDEFSFVYLQGYGDGSFRSAVNYYAEPGGGFQAQAVNIASGDFNGDGIPDFVIGNTNKANNSSVTVFISNADGTLNPGVNYSNSTLTNYSLQYVAVADFNGDGKLDIAATDSFNGLVQIFTGNGDGTFTPGATYKTDPSTAANPVGLVVGDFNNDGKPDLAVVNNYGGIPPTSATVGILINSGNGFNAAVTYPLDNAATEITAAALVNGNKNLDLVVPLFGSCTLNPGPCPNPGTAVAILLGNGDGTFTSQPDFQLGATYFNPYYAAVGDLNGDGIPDLAVTIEDQKNFHQGIAVAFGKGDGTFQAPSLVPSTVNPAQDVPLPGYIHTVDLNQDGIPDLVYSNSQFSTVGVLYGAGSGAFYDPIEFPADRWAWGLALVDYNGDGATDVVVSGNSLDFSGVAVLFNTGGVKTTLTSSANPSTTGAAVTFTATVASPVKGITAVPTGTVTFSNGGTALGSATLNSAGVATFKSSPLAGGAYSITAQYSGDTNFLPNTSAVLNQMVPAYTLSANPGSQTVNPGSSAVYKISQAALGGYNGTVSFPASACSGLPTGTACSFSASSIVGSGATTLTITTTGPSGALMVPGFTPHTGAFDLWASLGGVGLVGMMLAGDWSGRNRRRMGIALAILAVIFLITLVGCGGSSNGGGGGGGGNSGTPAGTYTVQVTVKDGTGTLPTNGPLKLTLVVN